MNDAPQNIAMWNTTTTGIITTITIITITGTITTKYKNSSRQYEPDCLLLLLWCYRLEIVKYYFLC